MPHPLHRALLPAFALAIASCALGPAPDPPRGFAGPGVAIAVAALDLPAVGDVVWDLEVANGDGQIVWQRRVTSSGYGDGAGSASYLGPCDAAEDVKSNVIRLWVVGVYADPVATTDAGSFAAGATTGVGAVAGALLDFPNPTAAGALARTFTCLPNADAAVQFDVTLLRPAAQGFFDIAITFNDLFCSAKYDCCHDTGDHVCAADGSEDILLLFDPDGQRGTTHVLGFACTAGADDAVLTRLYMNDLAIDCSDPYTPPFAADLAVHVGAVTPGNLCVAGAITGCAAVTAVGVNADDHLYQVAVYRGAEQLTNGAGSARKVYWNVALGVNDLSGCRLMARATADDHADPLDGLSQGVVAAGAIYPYVQWDVNLTTCASEALTFGGGAGPVVPSYTTAASGGASFASFYDAVDGAGSYCGSTCLNGGSCQAGVCQCLPGYSGDTCALLDTPLALSPLAPIVGFGSATTFTASGGAGAYTFSVVSGGGAIAPATGVYTAPNVADTTVVRVTDAAGNVAETPVSVCPDRTVASNATLPPDTYCYGTLTVNNAAVFTLDGDAASGAGVTIHAGNVLVASGAAISADGRGYGAGLGPGAGGGSANTVANESSSGGGHGGAGGTATCGPAGGAAYDDPLAPILAGSGGDTSEALAGGRGGGVVRLIVNGTLTLDGVLRSNGAGGTLSYNKASGGGAGGGIWVTAGALSGAGSISARGADSVRSTYGCHGGAGGGGRIAVYAGANTSTVSYDVSGGVATLNGPATVAGGTGTWAHAYADVLTIWGFATTFSADTSWTGLVVSSNASATITPGATLTLDTLLVRGTLTNNGTLSVASTLALADGGSYIHGATAALDAVTATLTMPSGTGNWNIAPTNAVVPRVGSVSVPAGATLSHATNGATHARSLRLATVGDVTVAGAIDVAAKGYAAGAGPGAGLGTTPVNQTGSGGGHGGAGATTAACVVLTGGPANGDAIAPSGLGSGGGTSGIELGGAGGGEVQLSVGGTLTVTGAIRADGASGTASYNYASGGGAGGTVRIDAVALAGTGTFSAHGGASVKSTFGCSSGAGGGGRVAITADTSTFSGSYDLAAGGGFIPGAAGTRALAYAGAYDLWNFALSVSGAEAWSVLTVASNASVTVQPGAHLSLNSLQLSGAVTNSGTLSLATAFTLAGGGRYRHTAAATLDADSVTLTVPSGTAMWDVDPAAVDPPQVGSATIPGGAVLTHTANGATHSFSLLLDTLGDLVVAGAIDVSTKGYRGGAGPGAGVSNATVNTAASGGGHGGGGGPATLCAPSAGGGGYDLAAAPTVPGSGGGDAGAAGALTFYGGAGGGVVALVVGGTLQLGGAIRADGGSNLVNLNHASGGGAGGSIWINTNALAGAGTLSARGGNAARAGFGCKAGAGGGGRIAVYPATNTSSVTASAAAGTGDTATNNGVAGSVVF